ncbi:hypothetical protein LCGC14_1512810 [marine sediment metagenome]|uniref:Uncharacterized protein n=1 Tax=marine sediment metagenome TaxID=412755 RepID=A0A0F9J175_9ZZZZ
MEKYEIIPITTETFGDIGTHHLIRVNLEVEASNYLIEDGIGMFYNNNKLIHSVPADKVIVRKV